MAENDVQAKPRGVLGKLAFGAISIVIFLFFSLIFSLCVEWGGILADYWGPTHAFDVLSAEIKYISHIDKHPLVDISLYSEAVKSANGVYSIAVDSLIGPYLNGSGVVSVVFRSSVWVVQIFVVRLTVVVFALPMFILVGLVALINGLDERDVRKFEGGTESSFIYDLVRPLIFGTVFVSSIVYISLPFQVNPSMIYLPAMAGLYYSVYTASSMFMKTV